MPFLVQPGTLGPRVRASGTDLTLDGQPWVLHGASTYPITGSTPAAVVARAQALGLNTVRVTDWINQADTSAGAPLDEARLAQIDAHLAAYQAAGLLAILDMSCYRNWLIARGTNPYTHDWTTYLTAMAARYGRNQTIALVSFMGEPEFPYAAGQSGPDPAKAPSNAQLVAAFDHVFTTWRQAGGRQLREPALLQYSFPSFPWQAIMALASCDVPSVHAYPAAGSTATTSPDTNALPAVAAYTLGTLGKPLLLEETGMERTASTTDAQAAAWLTARYAQRDELGLAGVSVWNMGPQQVGVGGVTATFDIGPQAPLATAAVLQASPGNEAPDEPAAPAGRIYVNPDDTTRLMLDGQPYRATGVNWHWAGLRESNLQYPTHAMIDAALDGVLAMTGPGGVIRAHTLGISVGLVNQLVTGINDAGQLTWNQAAWEPIDYVIAGCRTRGLKLCIPFTDQYNYYHLGKLRWVKWAFQHQSASGIPSTYTLDGTTWTGVHDIDETQSVYATQRQKVISQQFYRLPWIYNAFNAYTVGWLQHVNQFTGVAHKDEPAVAFVQSGNEIAEAGDQYTDHAGADGYAWHARWTAAVKAAAPWVLTVDGTGAENTDPDHMPGHADPNTDILDVQHLYQDTLPATLVTANAAKAAAHGKVAVIGEAPMRRNTDVVYSAIEETGAVAWDAFWALYTSAEGHNGGSSDGSSTDDTTYYVGQDETWRARVAQHAAIMSTGTPPPPPPPPVNILASQAAAGCDAPASSYTSDAVGGSTPPALTKTTTGGVGGGAALVSTSSSPGHQWVYIGDPTAWAPVTAGQTYSAAAVVKLASGTLGSGVYAHLTWFRADGSYISGATSPGAVTVTGAGFVQVAFTGTAPADAAKAAPQVEFDGPASGVAVLYIDNWGVFAGTRTA